MALTYIKMFVNNQPNALGVANPEAEKDLMAIPAFSGLVKDLKVPWVFNENDSKKAVRLFSGDFCEDVCYLFQGKNKAGRDCIMYQINGDFIFDGSQMPVPGESDSGGDKILFIYADGKQFDLKMIAYEEV